MRFEARQSGHSRESYHHGNLREALIAVALSMIAERGPAGFSFAELARAAGVSPAAPYRHFRDRPALLGEIARRGFEQFADELERAWNHGRPDPVSAIETCGRAHLDFARREPALYAAMFDGAHSFDADPALRAASERAFGTVRQAAESAVDQSRSRVRPPAMMVALHIWSLAHGVASLFVGRSNDTRFKLPMPAEDLLEAGLLIYLQSLGLNKPGR